MGKHEKRIHQATDHLQCQICLESFPNVDKLTIHGVREHGHEKPHQCNYCGQSFAGKQTLQKHMITHSNERPFTCDLCGKGFLRKEGLNKHTLTHKINEGKLTEEEKNKIELQKKPCEFCGRKFSDLTHLSRHLKSHMGIKDYVCSECGKAYTEKRYRDDHYNTVHLGLKNYPCEHCGKSFASYNSLSAHIKNVHGIAPKPKSTTSPQAAKVQTEFACDACGKVYKSKGARNTHFDKAHLGDIKLPCRECGKLFDRSGALQVHMTKEHPLQLVNEGERKELSPGMPAVNSLPNEFALKCEGIPL